MVWCDGRIKGSRCWMEPPERVSLPAAFEEVDVDILVQLIGVCNAALCTVQPVLTIPAADMMERLMAHNDRIPLSPCARTLLSR